MLGVGGVSFTKCTCLCLGTSPEEAAVTAPSLNETVILQDQLLPRKQSKEIILYFAQSFFVTVSCSLSLRCCKPVGAFGCEQINYLSGTPPPLEYQRTFLRIICWLADVSTLPCASLKCCVGNCCLGGKRAPEGNVCRISFASQRDANRQTNN